LVAGDRDGSMRRWRTSRLPQPARRTGARAGPRRRACGARKSTPFRRRTRGETTPGRDAEGCGTTPSGSLRREPARARHLDEIRQPTRFGFRDRGPERRDPVIPPPLVVLFGRRALARLDDETVVEHALNRAVQRAGAEPNRAAGPVRDVLN